MIKQLVTLCCCVLSTASDAQSFNNPYISFELGGSAQIFANQSDVWQSSDHDHILPPSPPHDFNEELSRPDFGSGFFTGLSAGVSFNRDWGAEIGYRIQDISVDPESQTIDISDSPAFKYWLETQSDDTVEMKQLRLAGFREFQVNRYVKSKLKLGITQSEYQFSHRIDEWHDSVSSPGNPSITETYYLNVNEKVVGGYAGIEVGVLLTRNINLNLFVDMSIDEFMMQTNAGLNTAYYF